MKSLFKLCLPLLAASLLVACGGGGGSDGHGGFTPPMSGKIELSAETQDLPLNTVGSLPNPGGPFTSEVTVSVRHHDGRLATEIDTISVHISPVSVATFSTLDDPETEDVNEILERWGDAPVDVVAGRATLFVTSNTNSGTARLTVTAVPPDDDPGNVSFQAATMDFTVGNVAAPVPRNVEATAQHDGVYVGTSGGRSTTIITAVVTDAGNQMVPDGSAPNLRFEVLGSAANGSLTAGNSTGQQVEVRTTRGVASASFRAGTTLGPITVRISADGADNDVSNGISDPVTKELQIVVSDGRPHSVTLVSPIMAAIAVNSVGNNIEAPVQIDDDGNVILPVDEDGNSIPLDGSYSLTVSALVNDRQGNPALPGTTVQFGAVDAPLQGFPSMGAGWFTLSGVQGNPREGGTLFTAVDGHFTLVPGGGPQDKAGPGDTLLVYGKAVEGNSDLESALKVAQVTGPTSLHVNSATPFNLNDITGTSVDFGSVLPWAIGRAQSAAITNQGVVNDRGIASVRLTYPINQLGKHVAVFAQTNGHTSGDPGKIVADIGDMRFPGVAPARIAAFPTPVPGNTTIMQTVCVYDALSAPLAGLPVSFGFHDLGAGGQGWVDGHPGAGMFDGFTDLDGCATGELRTVGISEDAAGGGVDDAGVYFNAAGASVNVPISASGSLILMARPSGLGGSGGKVTLTLVDAGGNPVPGVQIAGTCEASGSGALISITAGPGVTNADGETTATIVASGLNGYNEANDGTCTFTTAGGEPTVDVTLVGTDMCTLGFSPAPPPQCFSGGGSGLGDILLTIVRDPASPVPGPDASVASNPAGLSCTLGGTATSQTCSTASFPTGTQITLMATSSGTPTFSWSGDCAAVPGVPQDAKANIDESNPRSCVLTVH